jgi:hypothetical protein
MIKPSIRQIGRTVCFVFLMSASALSQEPYQRYGAGRVGLSAPLCNLEAALGTPGSRVLPTEPVPTHVSLMRARYWDLVATERGDRETGGALIELADGVVGPSGGSDDVGSYYLVPKLSEVLEITIAQAIDLFYSSLVVLAVLVGGTAFFVLFRSGRIRTGVLLALVVLAALTFKIGDIYIFQFFVAVVVLPWSLVLARRGTLRGWWCAFLFPVGILAGVANTVRSHAATGVIIFLLGILLFHISTTIPGKLVLLVCLFTGFLVPTYWFARMVANRDNILQARCPEYKGLTSHHPLWHSVYLGFGYLQNEYGISPQDSSSFQKVESIAPGTIYTSRQYEAILKHEVMVLLREHPVFVFMTLASKLGVVLCMLLISANVGLVAAALHPKPWPIEMSFWAAMAFNSLFGLLVVPLPAYMLGLITVGCLYGLVSIGFVLEPGFRARLTTSAEQVGSKTHVEILA